MRAAAVLSVVAGLGFGLPCVGGIRHFAQHGEVWTFMGFPTYGGGPFEHAGIHTSVPLLVGFLVVCAAEVVAGYLLWTEASGAVAFSFALLPFELAFWVGFALPFGPLLGLARVAVLLLAR